MSRIKKNTTIEEVSSSALSNFGEKERNETEMVSATFRTDLQKITAWTKQAMFVPPAQVAKGAISSGTKKPTMEDIVEFVKVQRTFTKWLESVTNQMGGVNIDK